MAFKLRKNASPYWQLNFIPSDKLPGANLENTQLWEKESRSKFKNTLPRNISEKVQEIRYTEDLEKGDRLDLVFRNLSVEESDTTFFAKSSGYELYLGWWDWFTSFRITARMFSGVVTTNSFNYEELGVTVTLALKHKGVIKADQPLPTTIFTLQNVNSVKDAVRVIAKYLGVRLAWAVKEKSVKRYLEKNLLKAKEPPAWFIPLIDFKIDSKTGRMIKTRITASSFLSGLSNRYGQIWYIHSNVLYFGPKIIDPFDKIHKVFRYRTQSAGEGSALSAIDPIAEDTFKSFTVINVKSVSIKNKVLSVNDTTKELSYTESKTNTDNLGEDVKIYDAKTDATTRNESILVNDEKIIRAKEKQEQIIGNKKKEAKVKLQNETDPGKPIEVDASSPDQAKASIAGKNEKASDNQVGGQISGARGDPFFGAWDQFFVSGVSNIQSHEGRYKAVKVIHLVTREDTYTMDIIGTKPRILVKKEFASKDEERRAAEKEKRQNEVQEINVFKGYTSQTTITEKEALQAVRKNNGFRSGPKAEKE